jgi:hypothetical protein
MWSGVREKPSSSCAFCDEQPLTGSCLVVFAIYVDSWLFVFATAVLQFGFGVDSALSICEAAILLCLVFYVTTKVFIYLFLVEKVVSRCPRAVGCSRLTEATSSTSSRATRKRE